MQILLTTKINNIVRQLPGIKWSHSHKEWHLPAENKSIETLKQKVNSLAIVDTSMLKKQLEEKKKRPLSILPQSTQKLMLHSLSADNQTALDLFIKTLQLKVYSANTIKTYRNEFGVLLKLLGNHIINDLQEKHIKSYILYLFSEKKLQRSASAHCY